MHLSPKTYLAFSLALTLQIIATITWHASHPHLTQLSRYLPYIWILLCGGVIGLLENRGYLRKTLVLGVLMSIVNSIIHWGAAQFGVPVDFGDASASAFFAIVGMPIFIALSMLGGTLGSLANRAALQRRNNRFKNS